MLLQAIDTIGLTIKKARIQDILVSLHNLQAFLTHSVTEILYSSPKGLTVRVSNNSDSVVKDCLFLPAKAALMEMSPAVLGLQSGEQACQLYQAVTDAAAACLKRELRGQEAVD